MTPARPDLLPAEDAITLPRLMAAARKSWGLILLIGASVLVATAFYTLRQRPIYQSKVTVQIDPNPVRPLGKDVQGVVDIGTGAYWSNQEYYNTQYKIIQSRKIAEQTVQKLGLNLDVNFMRNQPGDARGDGKPASVELAGEVLRSRLTVEPVKDSRLVVISLEDASPTRAQRIVATLAEIYVEQNIDRFVDSTNSAVEWLGEQLDKLKKELEQSEFALHQYKQKNSILSLSLDDQSNMLRAEMTQLNDQLTNVRTRIEHLSARAAEIEKLPVDDLDKLAVTELLQNAVVNDLRKSYLDAVRERDSLLRSGKGEEHPQSLSATSRVETAKAALLSEIRNVRLALKNDLVASRREAEGLRSLFANSEKRALDLNLLEMEYGRLQRSKNNTEKLYSVVLDRTKESGLSGLMRFNNIMVVDSAQLPKGPIKPNVTSNLAIGAFAGLLLGFMVALGRDLLDRSVKHPEQLETDLGLTFLGTLPRGDAADGGRHYGRRNRRTVPAAEAAGRIELLGHTDPTSGLAEAARAIRTNILFMSPDNPHRRLLITSAGPSEGKTTAACCIAVAMAQAGQRVLLVDCDLRRPRIHRVFGKTNDVGVTTALLDPASLDAAIQSTPVQGMSVLVSGPQVPNPAEILQSDAFGHLLDELSGRFDRVVIDSPPIVPVTDATVLSKRVDGLILVVRAFATNRELVRQAVRVLRDVSAPLIGALLNGVDSERSGYSQYQYYYSRGYGDNPTSTGDRTA
ncbi:MAG: polysaccharide biosynthesis tyrosine autokinase [Polyangiaceae bacterium]|nr:polysaccharide biosynthesis tyrosine autokinase [Polyangiaceae bacterium]